MLRTRLVEFVRPLYERISAYQWNDRSKVGGTARQVHILKREILAAAIKCAQSDLVVGPGQMVRRNQSSASLTALLCLAWITKSFGGQVRIVGVGAERLPPGPRRILWKRILKLSDFILVRDEASAANIREMAGRSPELAPDIAFLGAVLSKRSSSAAQPYVLAALCNSPSEGRVVASEIAAAAIERVVRRASLSRVVFLIQDEGVRGEDEPFALECQARLEQALPGLEISVVSPDSIEAFEAVLGSAEAVITNRLHSAIGALIQRTPVIVLKDSSTKLDQIVTKFNQSSISGEGGDLASVEVLASSSDDGCDLIARFSATIAEKLEVGFDTRTANTFSTG